MPDIGTKADWYIISTYVGQEDSVKKNLDLRIQSMEMEDLVFQAIVPTEDELVLKDGRRVPQRRKLFPGYVLVQMIMDNDTWFMVRNTPGVLGFISSESDTDSRPQPVPLEDSQLRKILDQISQTPTAVKVRLEEGETVRIREGPFADFVGKVTRLNLDTGKVQVTVTFFGRDTPIELDVLQVERG